MTIEISPQTAKELFDIPNVPEFVEVAKKRYRMHKPVAKGHKGVVWQVTDENSRLRALKLAVAEDYVERSYKEEISRAAKLEAYPEFATPIDAGPTRIKLPSGEQKFIAFLETWIPGETLDAFLKNRPESITASFFGAYVRAAAAILRILEEVELQHDDLHDRNIMVCPPPPGSLSIEWSFKVIDLGSLKPRSRITKKQKDDHRHVVDHLIAIWNTIHHRRTLHAAERRFLNDTRHLLRQMLEDDLSVALRAPAQIAEQFESALTRSRNPQQSASSGLQNPFVYLSAEHIADDQVLVSLFADTCPWLEQVSGPDPCLVTGPRGCGKSTIFRWLSLKAHLIKPAGPPADLRIAGFYISCSADLQNRLGWISTEESGARYQPEVVHYFNLILAREVAQTLVLIAGRHDRESYWGLGTTQESEIRNFFLQWFSTHQEPLLQGVSRLAQAVEVIESEILRTHLVLSKRRPLENPTSTAFLGDLTDLLTRILPRFRERRIVFLVDDFSIHRLPAPVQRILNRVIWERRPSHIFKLSSEKYGAILTDVSDASIDIGREMIEIDCGQYYIYLDEMGQKSKAMTFAIDLLNHRLRAANYAGTAESLLGRSDWPQGSLGRALVEDRQAHNYRGMECIAQLCSGDVSSLLQVYSAIFRLAKVDSTTTKPIPARYQHEAVVEVSRRVLENIRPAFPCGPKMHEVVNCFGTLVRRILDEGRYLKDGDKLVPCQCPRIEIDQPAGAVTDHLGEDQELLARELVRRAIFVEMTPGLARHDSSTTLRWHLRRVFLPAFGAALAKNDAIKKDLDWLKYFLTNPAQACDDIFKEWRKKAEEGKQEESRKRAEEEKQLRLIKE